MMKMLKLLGLTVFVVCIAAFASGCGGGGGGGSAMMEEEMPPPVMECPQGQVGTYPDCTDPGPTDEERIAAAREILADIVAEARSLAQTASLVAAAVGVHPDATAEQIDIVLDYAANAQAALVDVLAASSAGDAAATLAQAQTAVTDAQAALNDLTAAQSAAASIQSAVEAVASQRQQMQADETALTGGSSLIRHLRDNRKISDLVLNGNADGSLSGLAVASLLGGATGANTGSATYPYHKGDPATQYPVPSNTDRGVLGVTVSVGTTPAPVSSSSQTGKISGSGRLSNGFDLKNTDDTLFATVYTDITVAQRVRQKVGNTAAESATVDDESTMDIDERYQYVADDDYLLAGIWLDDSTAGSPALRAFAYGSQPLAADHDFCTAADVTNTTTLSRECGNADGRTFNTIAGFLDENESTEATYSGGVNGAYFAGGKASYFNANVSLTATFVRGTATDATGSKISGAITNISAGGNSITGSIDLKEQPLGNDITAAFTGEAAGVIEGHAYTGNWRGQFFGMRATKTSETADVSGNTPERTTTTTYTPDKPNSVAGSFYVDRQTVGEGDAAFIGSFGAHR